MKQNYNTPAELLNNIALLIYQHSGISFPANHLRVLDQRIQSRIKEKNCTEQEFYGVLLNNKEQLFEFIGYVTTNHTHFFRSIEQFNILGSHILPELIQKNNVIKHFYLWSCACSSGEEPYSLALYIQYYLDVNKLSDWSFSIIATDIDHSSLDFAREGTYNYQALTYIPPEYHTYLDIHHDLHHTPGTPISSYVKIPDAIKKHIRFDNYNLMDPVRRVNMDIIFCRNVLIYFDLTTQEEVVSKLSKALNKDRYFFLSPSESLTGLKTPLSPVITEKTIYYTNNL